MSPSDAGCSPFAPLSAVLHEGTFNRKCNDTAHIFGPSAGSLDISFQRTLRVPDNQGPNYLPPSLGTFPLYSVANFQKTLPADMAAKGGLLFPMYQREAVWLNFTARKPFASKIFLGGVNAVSGEPKKDNSATMLYRLTNMANNASIQDYVVMPKQLWLDGIATKQGFVRQFVATPLGSGYSIEAQITGQEVTGERTLGDYNIRNGFTLHLVLRIRGGGPPYSTRPPQLGIAPGGLIKQCIIEDPYPASIWDADRAISFNVQILNLEVFQQFTGMAPPATPISAQTYISQGLPFFDIYNEHSKVEGNFKNIKSVAMIDTEKRGKKRKYDERVDESPVDNSVILLNPDGTHHSFKPVSVLKAGLGRMNHVQF